MTDPQRHNVADSVALVLAAGIAVALNVMVLALLWAAFLRLGAGGEGISQGGVQLLTGWGGGIIGVLGSYVGFTFGRKRDTSTAEPPPADLPRAH